MITAPGVCPSHKYACIAVEYTIPCSGGCFNKYGKEYLRILRCCLLNPPSQAGFRLKASILFFLRFAPPAAFRGTVFGANSDTLPPIRRAGRRHSITVYAARRAFPQKTVSRRESSRRHVRRQSRGISHLCLLAHHPDIVYCLLLPRRPGRGTARRRAGSRG